MTMVMIRLVNHTDGWPWKGEAQEITNIWQRFVGTGTLSYCCPSRWTNKVYGYLGLEGGGSGTPSGARKTEGQVRLQYENDTESGWNLLFIPSLVNFVEVW